jgi:tetratricopeptide (TPR) repeat protein
MPGIAHESGQICGRGKLRVWQIIMSFHHNLLVGLRFTRRLGLARRADEARNTRFYADAAEAYRAALALAPQRTDIRVQYGNMLKDAGRLAEADAVYRSALAEKPDDADIHLQLGHCLKLQCRRAAALTAYVRLPVWLSS